MNFLDLLMLLALACLLLSELREGIEWQFGMLALAIILLTIRLLIFFKIGPFSLLTGL